MLLFQLQLRSRLTWLARVIGPLTCIALNVFKKAPDNNDFEMYE